MERFSGFWEKDKESKRRVCEFSSCCLLVYKGDELLLLCFQKKDEGVAAGRGNTGEERTFPFAAMKETTGEGRRRVMREE
jgi:hypothetical protein